MRNNASSIFSGPILPMKAKVLLESFRELRKVC